VQSAKRKAQSAKCKAQSAKCKAQNAGEGNYIRDAAFQYRDTNSPASVHVASFVNIGLQLIVVEIFTVLDKPTYNR